jgi:hypothetical protein
MWLQQMWLSCIFLPGSLADLSSLRQNASGQSVLVQAGRLEGWELMHTLLRSSNSDTTLLVSE